MNAVFILILLSESKSNKGQVTGGVCYRFKQILSCYRGICHISRLGVVLMMPYFIVTVMALFKV